MYTCCYSFVRLLSNEPVEVSKHRLFAVGPSTLRPFDELRAQGPWVLHKAAAADELTQHGCGRNLFVGDGREIMQET